MTSKYLVVLDAGHGGKDPGAIGATGTRESDFNLKIVNKMAGLLSRHDIEVKLTRTDDSYISLSDRVNFANNNKADYVISIHCNSASNPSATGTETFANSPTARGYLLAQPVHKALVQEIKLPDRGVKFADFTIIAKTKAPACLVEVGFINNPKEEALLKDDKFLDKVSVGIVKGLLQHIGINFIPDIPPVVKPTNGFPIISNTKTTVAQMQEWAKRKGAHQTFIDLAPTYYKVSQNAGVNPLVTYAQSAKETGYFKFGGVLNITYNNPCGMKISAGGGDKDPNAHMRFKSWEEGIQAQVDHLALYAGQNGYPKANTPDPRHFAFIKGTAPTVEDLGGKWAPSATYGVDIVKRVKEIEATVAPVVPVDPYTKDIMVNLLGRLITVKGRFKNNTNYLIVKGEDIPIRDIFESMGFVVTWENNMVVIK